jgi:hypothetical protein
MEDPEETPEATPAAAGEDNKVTTTFKQSSGSPLRMWGQASITITALII